MNPPLSWDDSQLTAADVGIWASVVSRFNGHWYPDRMRLYQISMAADTIDFATMRTLTRTARAGALPMIHIMERVRYLVESEI